MASFDPFHASRALTVSAELVANSRVVEELKSTLQEIHDDLVGDNAGKDRPVMQADGKTPVTNLTFRPNQLPDTHFMRFVIIEDPRLPALLVWECNHDGGARDYLRLVWAASREKNAILQFDKIFSACKDYPTSAQRDPWVEWFVRRTIRAEAFYCGYRGVTKKHVDAAGRVHEEVRAFADLHRDTLATLPAAEIHRRIREHLTSDPPPGDLKQGDTELIPDPRPGFAARKRRVIITAIILGILLLPVLIPILVLGIPYLLIRERLEKVAPIKRAVHAAPDLIAVEDRIIQNQLTHVVDVKGGPFRYFLQRAVLLAIDQLARWHYVNGHLGHITSIHFGRWVLLKDTRWWRFFWRHDRLLFFSNYDFSWDSYLGEFVDRQATGLTAVWSNTEGFPRTFFLIRRGATDEERFKQWARDHQIASQVWWSGVRHSSVENVNIDLEIHRGALDPAPQNVERWLRRL